MTDKPDPAKDAGRTDTSAGKRPHATLDLKATEVKAADAPAATSAAVSAPGGPAPNKDKDASSAASPKSPAGSSSSASTEPAGKGAAPASASAAKSQPSANADAQPAPRSGGGFFSHLAAGVIGGALVYSAAAFLGPDWLPTGAGGGVTELNQRIAALEAAPKGDAEISALSSKLSDAEAKLSEIETLKQSLSAVEGAQQKLTADAQSQDGANATTRLSKLEEQLSILAASANTADGRVPQLAAITGKITDLETALGAQIADLRKSLPAEVDQRLAVTAETSEAAKSAASRLDREMSQIRTDQARSAQRDEAVKADMDRLTAAVDAVKEEAGRLSSTLGDLRSSLDSQLKAVSRPADISAAVNPVATKIAELEQNIHGVVRNEQNRKQNVERIVLSLELSNLKRALDRGEGQGYAAELAEVKNASAGNLNLAPLERFATTGVASVPELKSEFRPVMNAVIDADLDPVDGSVLDRLLAGAKSVVRVRKVSHESGDTSAEAIVGRIEAALNDNRLGDVITQAKTLPPRAQVPIEDWLVKVQARHAVDDAIAAIDSQLKASLAGVADPPPAPPVSPVPPQQN